MASLPLPRTVVVHGGSEILLPLICCTKPLVCDTLRLKDVTVLRNLERGSPFRVGHEGRDSSVRSLPYVSRKV